MWIFKLLQQTPEELTKEWIADAEQKWAEIRRAKGHHISAWDPRFTEGMDTLKREERWGKQTPTPRAT